MIDCIDNLETKADLLAHCVNNQIPIVSSGGAGMKADFTRFQVNPLSKSTVDPLTRALKRELKKRKIDLSKVQMIYSAEKTETMLLPLNKSQEKDLDEAQIIKGFRIRIVPVLGTSPALFGIAIAAYIITKLGNTPFKPFELTDIRYQNYTKVHNRFYNNERNKVIMKKYQDKLIAEGNTEFLIGEIFDIPDFVFLLKDVFKWHCQSCLNKAVTSANLYIFDSDKPIDSFNVVLLCKKCGKIFKEDDNSEMKSAVLQKLEVIWSQMEDLKLKFDPYINTRN